MCRMVNIAPRGTTTHTHSPRCRIDLNILHEREIDDQAVVANSQSSGVMASASNRNSQIMLPSEMDSRYYRAQTESRFAMLETIREYAIESDSVADAMRR